MLNFNFLKNLRGSSLLFLALLLSSGSFFLSGCLKDDSSNELEEEIRKQQEAFLKQLGADTVLIKQHLADQGITNAKRTPSGLFYVEQVAGAGKGPVANKQVRTQYRLQNMEGETLDQGTFPFTMGARQVVVGFEEGVSLMKVGGKSTLFIPSGLGYGPGGSQPKIGPNEILVFDVELLEAQQ
ncbi:MAG: FKBP-type peptidyl-prolyl cis-trans isomerase [Adhaeribacter sp.]